MDTLELSNNEQRMYQLYPESRRTFFRPTVLHLHLVRPVGLRILSVGTVRQDDHNHQYLQRLLWAHPTAFDILTVESIPWKDWTSGQDKSV